MSSEHGKRPKIRTKKGEKALRDIDMYQNRFHGNLLPYAPVKRITGRILRERNPEMQIRKTAVRKIIDEMENHAVCQFKAAQLLAIHAGRITIQKEDMETANKVWALLGGREIRTEEPVNEKLIKKRKKKHEKDIEYKKKEKKQKRREKRQNLKEQKLKKSLVKRKKKRKKRTIHDDDLLNNSNMMIGNPSSDYINDIDRVLVNPLQFPLDDEEEEEYPPLLPFEMNGNTAKDLLPPQEEEEEVVEKSRYTYKTKLASESCKYKPSDAYSKVKEKLLAIGISVSSSEEEDYISSHDDDENDDDYREEEDVLDYDSEKEEEEEERPNKRRKYEEDDSL